MELLHAARSSQPTFFVDGLDTAVLNPWASTTGPAALAGLREDALLVGGECTSWPLCYEAQYEALPAFRRCRESGSPSCYPNGGTFFARAGTMLAFLTSLEAMVEATQASPNHAEKGYDQAAVHWLMLKRQPHSRAAASNQPPPTAPSATFDLQVDSESSIFFNLYPCTHGRMRKLVKGFVACYYTSWYDPMRRVRVRGAGAALAHELSADLNGSSDRKAALRAGDCCGQIEIAVPLDSAQDTTLTDCNRDRLRISD